MWDIQIDVDTLIDELHEWGKGLKKFNYNCSLRQQCPQLQAALICQRETEREREKQRRNASVKNRNMAGGNWGMKAQGGACKTNNKEKREASSTGKLPGSSKNIHKQTTNIRAEVAGDDVSSGAESGNCCSCCCCCKCCQDAN